MSRYRGLVIIAVLALLVSTLFFQRSEAQKSKGSETNKHRLNRRR